MNLHETDADWEAWGEADPYFGVLTDPKYRRENLTEEARQEFFQSGRDHVQHVFERCRHHFDPSFSPKSILDFGCGTGRLILSFAPQADEVVGVDVSTAMLKETEDNCRNAGLANVRLFRSDDALSSIDRKFDLIHSFIVLQHIPTERGRRLFIRLLELLRPGGIGAIQVTYAAAAHAATFGITPSSRYRQVRRFVRTLLTKCVKRRGGQKRLVMQMNPYNLNELYFILQQAGIKDIVSELTDHGGQLGAFLFFRKPR